MSIEQAQNLIFERDRYVLLPGLLKQPLLGQFYRYVCRSVELNRLRPGDDQVAGTPCAYGDFIMDGLLTSLQQEIEGASGLS